MSSLTVNTEMLMLRNLSSAFSRNVFTNVLEFDDYTHLDWLLSEYIVNRPNTYSDLLNKIYARISKKYRCEYVYKNELIKVLIKKYGTRNSVFFSEFRVGRSIADIVVFNGQSKAFEIKTEYDSSRRLKEQLACYKRLFDKCYIVVPEELCDSYKELVDNSIGIILMKAQNSSLSLYEVREATVNEDFDVMLMMSCLRTKEYEHITKALGHSIEHVSCYDLYDYCMNIMANSDVNVLRQLFLAEVKKRKNNTCLLKRYPMPIRQMMLSLNLPQSKADLLLKKLKSNI